MLNRAVRRIAKKFYRYLPPQYRGRLPNSRDFLLKAMPKNSICAEIGVFEGYFSSRILRIVKPKKIYLIDPWETEKEFLEAKVPWKPEEDLIKIEKRYNKVINRFSSEIKNEQVLVKRGRSANILNNFEDNYFDWVYIDGSHFFEDVKNDLELSYQKVRKGGFITGDDYLNDNDWYRVNTTRAIDQFIAKGLVELIKTKNRQFILEKN